MDQAVIWMQHQVIMGGQEDQENVNPIGNSIIRRPKGRPPRTVRFKGLLQMSTQSNEAFTGRKCGLCSKNGHNRACYMSNESKLKEKKQ